MDKVSKYVQSLDDLKHDFYTCKPNFLLHPIGCTWLVEVTHSAVSLYVCIIMKDPGTKIIGPSV